MSAVDLLQGIELVSWSELTHAYGSASDVPRYLRTLATPEAAQRTDAWSHLEASIFHQGRVFPVTARAVAFLVRLALAPQVPERQKVLEFLTTLSGGRIESVPGHAGLRDGAEGQDVKEALQAAGPAFVELLSDPEPKIRASATVVIGVSSTRSEELLNAVSERMGRETDVTVLASEVFVLPRLGGTSRLAPFLRHESRLVRFAAAIATCRGGGDDSLGEAMTILLAALKDPAIEGYPELPWATAGVRGDACLGLCGLGDALPAEQFAEILDAFQALADSDAAVAVGLELLQLSFGEPAHGHWSAPKSVPFGLLTERQKATLRAFVRSDAVWGPIESRVTLGAHGLPMARDGMRRFVNRPTLGHDEP